MASDSGINNIIQFENHKSTLKYRNFVKSLLKTAKSCRGGRGQHYAAVHVDNTLVCIGIAPTKPSSKEYLTDCYKYKIIIGYDSTAEWFKDEHFEEICSMTRYLTDKSQHDRKPPFEWMKLVVDEEHFRDNGYMCRSWYVR